jgi:hypothetical protein
VKLAGSHRFLGLAVRDRSILAAEVVVASERTTVVRTAEFALPEGSSLEKPESLGEALGRFLRHQRFSASRVTVGVPARWLLARERDLPPATSELAAATLRLQAERQFGADAKDLVFDYAGQAQVGAPSKALLVAMPRQRLEQISQIADSAGLHLLAVTSSTLSLMAAQSAAHGEAGSGELLVWLEPGAAELAAGGQGVPRMLRHLPVGQLGVAEGVSSSAQASALGGDIRREVLLQPHTEANGSAPKVLTLWDGLGLDEATSAALLERVGMEHAPKGAYTYLGVVPAHVGSASPAEEARFAPAVALAVSAAHRNPAAIDFAHSRLLERKRRRFSGRRMLWAGAVALVILTAIGASVWDAWDRQRELASLLEQQQQMQPQVDAAEALVARVSLARKWYDRRPAFLACLREVTDAFPEQGQQIWATSLSIRDTGKATLDGKAADQRAVLAVRDRLAANKSFADVTLLDMRDAGGNRREVVFTLSLTFVNSASGME